MPHYFFPATRFPNPMTQHIFTGSGNLKFRLVDAHKCQYAIRNSHRQGDIITILISNGNRYFPLPCELSHNRLSTTVAVTIVSSELCAEVATFSIGYPDILRFPSVKIQNCRRNSVCTSSCFVNQFGTTK